MLLYVSYSTGNTVRHALVVGTASARGIPLRHPASYLDQVGARKGYIAQENHYVSHVDTTVYKQARDLQLPPH